MYGLLNYFRLLKNSKKKPYHIMNNMKYSRIISDFDYDLFAQKYNLDMDNDIFNNGCIIFKKNGKIVAIFDFVNQTLFSDDKNLIGF